MTEVARGGAATVSTIRLRCRAHNQYAAECTFGAEFMSRKREAAARVRKTAGPGTAPEAPAASQMRAAAETPEAMPAPVPIGMRDAATTPMLDGAIGTTVPDAHAAPPVHKARSVSSWSSLIAIGPTTLSAGWLATKTQLDGQRSVP